MLSLTADNVNAMAKLLMKDSVGKESLKTDFVEVVKAHFALTTEQQEGLSKLTLRMVKVQEAIEQACETPGGYIRMTGGPHTAKLIIGFSEKRKEAAPAADAQTEAVVLPERRISCTVSIFGATCHAEVET
jgi:hypothetical protein